MGRREKRVSDENRLMLMLGGGIILVGIIAFIISYMIYSNKFEQESKAIGENVAISKGNTINMISENTQDASFSIGKSVNEVENTDKVAVNTKNIEKETEIEQKNIEIENSTEKTIENTVEDINEESIKSLDFSFPVDGEILKDYAKENLVYSETLDEWTTHLGIDFKAEKTSIVKAVANGVVKSIKNDPRYGLTIVIEHDGGFESVYSSLLSSEFVTVGEEVKQGDAIGSVGNTATFEIADETHLHFELKQDGKNVDPNIYLK